MRLILAISGASGVRYGRRLLQVLSHQIQHVDLVVRSGRMYALLDVPEVSLPSLYLGWVGSGVEGALPPLASFPIRIESRDPQCHRNR